MLFCFFAHTGGNHGAHHTSTNNVYDLSLETRSLSGIIHNKYNINDVMDIAVDAHKEAWPTDWSGLNWNNGCDEACLKAQLASYYNGKGCEGIEPSKIGGEESREDDD